MMKMTNPFIVSGRIEPEYFCDRKGTSRQVWQYTAKSSHTWRAILPYTGLWGILLRQVWQ